jgi:hypothetical protein
VRADGGHNYAFALAIGFEFDVVKQSVAAEPVVSEMIHLDGTGASGSADGGFVDTVSKAGRQSISQRVRGRKSHWLSL